MRPRSRRTKMEGVTPHTVRAASLVTLDLTGISIAGLGPGDSAGAQDGPSSNTIATTLAPGWNLVSWTDLERPVSDFFEASGEHVSAAFA